MSDYIVLANNINANGTYPNTSGVAAPSPLYFLEVSGNTGGETVQLQELSEGHPSANWRNVVNALLSSPGSLLLKSSRGTLVRAVVTNATSGSLVVITLNAYDGER